MIERPVLRLAIGIGLPVACALVVEQLPKRGVADVPFPFQVDEQTLPPGTYSVAQADRGRGVRIQNRKVDNVSTECMAGKRKFGQAAEARLVFDNFGGRYYLSEIWFEADGRGLILPNGSHQGGNREVRYVRFQ